ncbi:protein preY, mitochondrial-like [Pimephales promelas]|uniref:protein preY, mitochondrial-like n=1 Tax=Pimephales promelas TaxID=90988 RepID=UPI0019556FA5|nr:protein preY, mitochondrial-like [Pimephales promelas]KAG1939122.1 Trm112 family protein [Pimephales promelas]
MSHALRTLATGVFSVQRSVSAQTLLRPVKIRRQQRSRSDGVKGSESQAFDVSLLEFLVCPLSKKPLRYDERNNELINEELGIAYPIIDGIPNMIPQDARMIQTAKTAEKPTES